MPDEDGFATFALSVLVFVPTPGVLTVWCRLMTVSPTSWLAMPSRIPLFLPG